ncbi:YbhB/YbcL family Raf kinase inhibitor-like protein [Cetobacterium somerae]|uniref:YbhB/YbcL family Raf kinase inhibitor-like protein n=1 Tax=Cetobacterium sp. NK01 TaxID=2993530 RepID=UPI0021171C66|nr:YbhB/YbcL family Raf kinase inhibitor-like protein [Cetobacterium sp. NK01]MCQ8211043.1 YbhB/YbcL family Raf kinase inhibitor-like protein [Cetobacterium sp. NK01]
MKSSEKFSLTSDSIVDGYIKDDFGKHGESWIDDMPSKSIELKWENVPVGTESFLVVMQDYDAIPVAGFSWIHWIAVVPKNYKELKEGASRTDKNIIQGINSWASKLKGLPKEKATFYGGPTPPDKDHLYEVKIYAIDKKLDLKNGFYLNEAYKKIKGHILGEAEIEGMYKS